MNILVGDVGGTNARFAVIGSRAGGLELLAEKTLPSAHYPSIADALAAFMAEHEVARASRLACFGVAGPVKENRCEATNLPWVVEGQALSVRLGIARVAVLNDLEAAAWGLAHVEPNGVRTLREGTGDAVGNRAVLAPGTGLGEAVLFWDGRRHHAFPTEGGHADFAPTDDLQVELWKYLRQLFGHVSYERVLSGPGLVSLFQFLTAHAGLADPAWLVAELAAGDAAAEISRRARDGECLRCRRALDLFFELMGAEAGNLALRALARGGIYLAGGIVPKLATELRESSFLNTFTAKGRFRPLLEGIPVRVVVDDRVGLWGAAAWALRSAEASMELSA